MKTALGESCFSVKSKAACTVEHASPLLLFTFIAITVSPIAQAKTETIV
ncbi:MAG: hypothetical protein LBD55_10705 [Treponema sp.]|nr:hypothetical protein [Treponema sp.]